jgi:hypothetical protein
MSLFAEIAIAIPLKVWQDPQGNVVLRYSREECLLFFGCRTEAGDPADYLCQLKFHHAWAVRGLRLEYLPYRIKDHKYHSRILLVENSQWLRQVSQQRVENYPEWRTWDTREYLHYVVAGHDNYYDIIATGFDELIVPENEAGELATLIHEA